MILGISDVGYKIMIFILARKFRSSDEGAIFFILHYQYVGLSLKCKISAI